MDRVTVQNESGETVATFDGAEWSLASTAYSLVEGGALPGGLAVVVNE